MRVHWNVTILGLATIAGLASASSPASSSKGSSAVVRETFATPDALKRWPRSKAMKKDSGESDAELLAYRGEWKIVPTLPSAGITESVPAHLENDHALVADTIAAHHAISHKFDSGDLDLGASGASEFVVQYDLKLTEGLTCGGAYLKVLTADPEFSPDEFGNTSNFTVMFGADKCGGTNKVHFIVNSKNPQSGEIVEHQYISPPPIVDDALTNTYTLQVSPETSRFEILVNGVSSKTGSLLSEDDFAPPFQPPKQIADESDTKPEDWIDIQKIRDPNATKPEDWNETAPREIVDTAARKPSSWDETAPLEIPDPEAEKPEDWDDEEDGVWEAPTIPNPDCEIGECGKWEPPLKPNPDYRGKWSAPLIDNPEYKGEWQQKQIANPNYFKLDAPAKQWKVGAVGIEIWTMSRGLQFDNIYIGTSFADAKALRTEYSDAQRKLETAAEKASNKNQNNNGNNPDANDLYGDNDNDDGENENENGKGDSVVNELLRRAGVLHFKRRMLSFLRKLPVQPIQTIKAQPTEGAAFAGLAVLIILLLAALIGAFYGNTSSHKSVKAKVKKHLRETDESEDNSQPSVEGEELVSDSEDVAEDEVVRASGKRGNEASARKRK